ncbi:hypothetical protein CDAR_542731 [Caerostris darwini]|uniref:Uncharacterized protein n=1 Tax=Caerostris darwini TaxID=1538125 RepID=A0AAV4WWS1_9ARAC|nr:hypothetical protein CDAR_542731 [Caerostris darwini]
MRRWPHVKGPRAGQKSRLWPVLTTDVSLIKGHSACALLPQERANIFLRLRTKFRGSMPWQSAKQEPTGWDPQKEKQKIIVKIHSL